MVEVVCILHDLFTVEDSVCIGETDIQECRRLDHKLIELFEDMVWFLDLGNESFVEDDGENWKKWESKDKQNEKDGNRLIAQILWSIIIENYFRIPL